MKSFNVLKNYVLTNLSTHDEVIAYHQAIDDGEIGGGYASTTALIDTLIADGVIPQEVLAEAAAAEAASRPVPSAIPYDPDLDDLLSLIGGVQK